jgi:hypothetical protein
MVPLSCIVSYLYLSFYAISPPPAPLLSFLYLPLSPVMAGNYFPGEIFIDSKEVSYTAMGLKRAGLMGLFSTLWDREAQERIKVE